jgi:DNA polymerase-3 subunit epsilon
LASITGVEVIDTLRMARDLRPGRKNSLDALCNEFGVDNSNRQWHGALLDAELLAEVYLAMTRGQNSLSMDFGGPRKVRRTDAAPRGPLRVVPASEAELADHERVLNEIAKEIRKDIPTSLYEWNLDQIRNRRSFVLDQFIATIPDCLIL